MHFSWKVYKIFSSKFLKNSVIGSFRLTKLQNQTKIIKCDCQNNKFLCRSKMKMRNKNTEVIYYITDFQQICYQVWFAISVRLTFFLFVFHLADNTKSKIMLLVLKQEQFSNKWKKNKKFVKIQAWKPYTTNEKKNQKRNLENKRESIYLILFVCFFHQVFNIIYTWLQQKNVKVLSPMRFS